MLWAMIYSGTFGLFMNYTFPAWGLYIAMLLTPYWLYQGYRQNTEGVNGETQAERALYEINERLKNSGFLLDTERENWE